MLYVCVFVCVCFLSLSNDILLVIVMCCGRMNKRQVIVEVLEQGELEDGSGC